MKYDYQKIGKRIKQERLEAKIKSQGALADKLGYSERTRQTIAKWEKGEAVPELDYLLRMCELFDCELGYLLCEYDCKTREITDIHDTTGLSQNAIKNIRTLKQSPISDVVYTLSKLIESPAFVDLLYAIHEHVWDFNNKRLKIDSINVKDIAAYLNNDTLKINTYLEAASKERIKTIFAEIVSEMK